LSDARHQTQLMRKSVFDLTQPNLSDVWQRSGLTSDLN